MKKPLIKSRWFFCACNSRKQFENNVIFKNHLKTFPIDNRIKTVYTVFNRTCYTQEQDDPVCSI